MKYLRRNGKELNGEAESLSRGSLEPANLTGSRLYFLSNRKTHRALAVGCSEGSHEAVKPQNEVNTFVP